ncbi:MAG: type I-E CRISPR-associated protein Cse1/CasA [Bradyrhizobium sp.]
MVAFDYSYTLYRCGTVNTETLDLVSASWLPVIRSSGRRERVRPAEISDRIESDPIVDLDFPRADFRGADRPPTEGFATIVDGHLKAEFDTVEAAEASGRELKLGYPRLQIEIYDAASKVRTSLS